MNFREGDKVRYIGYEYGFFAWPSYLIPIGSVCIITSVFQDGFIMVSSHDSFRYPSFMFKKISTIKMIPADKGLP